MLRRRGKQETVRTRERPSFEDFHEWVLSLPWVVERPYSVGTPGVRAFGVDCEPLGRRQLWLITGLDPQLEIHGLSLAVIIPAENGAEIEDAGIGRIVAPMPRRHALVSVYGLAIERRDELEALVLTAYGCAMS
jgi:hypothetical protein